MRLDKYVCKSTELTRDEAIQRIQSGEVSVNDKITTDEATQVHANNTVSLNGACLKLREFRYILMHKPARTVCSNVDDGYPSLFNFVDVENVRELHIAGRLDADATGMVLMTDDGHWSFNITAPTTECRKVYRVMLSRVINPNAVSRFANGVQLQGEKRLTLPARLEIVGSKEVLLTLTEGRYHQVKRMFAAVGNRVVALHREQIGDVYLDVEVGQWRYLTKDEVQSLGSNSER